MIYVRFCKNEILLAAPKNYPFNAFFLQQKYLSTCDQEILYNMLNKKKKLQRL